jgi:hypothetical protein
MSDRSPDARPSTRYFLFYFVVFSLFVTFMSLLSLGTLAGILVQNPGSPAIGWVILVGAFIGILIGWVIVLKQVPPFPSSKRTLILLIAMIAGAILGYIVGCSNLFGIVPTCDKCLNDRKPIIYKQMQVHADSTHSVHIIADTNMKLLAWWWIDSNNVGYVETDPDGCVTNANATFMTINPAVPITGPTIFLASPCAVAPHQVTNGTVQNGNGSYGFANGMIENSTMTETHPLRSGLDAAAGTLPTIVTIPYYGTEEGKTALIPYITKGPGVFFPVETINLLSYPHYLGDPTPYQWQCVGHDGPNTIMITVTAN